MNSGNKNLKLSLLLMFSSTMAGVSFASGNVEIVSTLAARNMPPFSKLELAKVGDESAEKVEFSGELVVPPCMVSEVVDGRFIQELPFQLEVGGGLQRVDNYVINFASCILDDYGLPFADIHLTKIFSGNNKVFLEPQFRLISFGQNAVDSIRVPLASDISTFINIGQPNQGPKPGLIYLRVYYPYGLKPLAAPYDNVTLEINYK